MWPFGDLTLGDTCIIFATLSEWKQPHTHTQIQEWGTLSPLVKACGMETRLGESIIRKCNLHLLFFYLKNTS